MLEAIRKSLFERAIRALLATQKRQRTPHTLESARTLAFVFDATLEKTRSEVREIGNALEKKGKKVTYVGLMDAKQTPELPGITVVGKKDLSWTGIPKSGVAMAFVKEKPDVLLCLNPEDRLSLHWIATASASGMKIGTATSLPNDFDLQLEVPAGKSTQFFMDQLALYLEKIVLTKYESAKSH